MDFHKLVPIESTRIDEETGIGYVFNAIPPVDIFVLKHKDWSAPKDFVMNFFWEILANRWAVDGFPNLEEDIKNIIPILSGVIADVKFHRKKEDGENGSGENFTYTYSFVLYETNDPKSAWIFHSNPPSKTFQLALLREVYLSAAVQIAASGYISAYKQQLDAIKAIDIPSSVLSEELASENPDQARLFPNSKNLDLNSQWAMPQFIANNLNRAVKGVNRKEAIMQYDKSGAHDRERKAAFKIQNKTDETEFVFDKEKAAIKTADQFANQLIKLRDAKVMQTFFALMKWINIKDSPSFRSVPISDIMELILKPNGENKFNTAQRREFSEVLEYLALVSITVSIIGERVNKKTGKSRPVLQEEKGVKLFRIVPEYSVRKEFQSIPRESLRDDIHFDKSVITRFSGEVLPGNARFFSQRGSIYFDSLLHLDANKDSKAIILGFTMQTRFNQLSDKEKYVEVDRPYLIDLCDYDKTNQTKPSQATKQLANNLGKLIESGIISKYEGLTNRDEDRIKIYPPKPAKVKELV